MPVPEDCHMQLPMVHVCLQEILHNCHRYKGVLHCLRHLFKCLKALLHVVQYKYSLLVKTNFMRSSVLTSFNFFSSNNIFDRHNMLLTITRAYLAPSAIRCRNGARRGQRLTYHVLVSCSSTSSSSFNSAQENSLL